MLFLKCKNCKNIQYSIAREKAVADVKKFNAFYDAHSKRLAKAMFGSKANLDSYERCIRCGFSHKQFIKAKKKDVPRGSTLQPIIHFDE